MNAKRFVALLVLVIVVAAGTTWWLGRADQKSADNGAVAEPSATASGSVAGGPSSESPRTRDHSENDTQHIADDGTAPVPRRYQIAGVTRVQTAASFEDWMAHFSEADQAILRDFNKRNHGVYRVHNPETVAWMAQHGYPMPEDVLAAQALSRETLRDLVKEGNVKAAFLLRSRDIAEIKRKMEENDEKMGYILRKNPQYREDWMQYTKHVINKAQSPYKAFLEADSARLTGNRDYEDVQVLAALKWASSLGDLRAYSLAERFVHSDPERMARRLTIMETATATAALYMQSFREQTGSSIAVRSAHNPTAPAPYGR